MSQHDMNLANGPGLTFRTDVNAALVALVSQSSGAVAPSPTYTCQLWADTGTGRIRQRDSANTQWLDLGPLDTGSRYPGRLIGIQILTASGTYTPTSGTGSVIVLGVGGGASGGASGATTASSAAAASGGGSGTYGCARFTSGFSGVTVTIGAGGAAPSAGTNNGAVGGTTSFGALLVCPGGTAGAAGFAQASAAISGLGGGNSTAPTGANILGFSGEGGGNGFTISATQGNAGKGGSNPLGVGGHTPVAAGARSGSGYGAGSSGAYCPANTAAQAGVAGQSGAIIVYEYA
jgi:hypothetical protein